MITEGKGCSVLSLIFMKNVCSSGRYSTIAVQQYSYIGFVVVIVVFSFFRFLYFPIAAVLVTDYVG